MSKSIKRHNYGLWVCCDAHARRNWGKKWHRSFRTKTRVILREIQSGWNPENKDEPLPPKILDKAFPVVGEGTSDEWCAPQDGHQHYNGSLSTIEKKLWGKLLTVINGGYEMWLYPLDEKLISYKVDVYGNRKVEKDSAEKVTRKQVKERAYRIYCRDIRK